MRFPVCAGSLASLLPTIIKCGFFYRWTRMPRSIGGLNTSADHGLFLAAFITNTTESEFFGTHKGEKPCNDGGGRSSPNYLSASDPRSFSVAR